MALCLDCLLLTTIFAVRVGNFHKRRTERRAYQIIFATFIAPFYAVLLCGLVLAAGAAFCGLASYISFALANSLLGMPPLTAAGWFIFDDRRILLIYDSEKC